MAVGSVLGSSSIKKGQIYMMIRGMVQRIGEMVMLLLLLVMFPQAAPSSSGMMSDVGCGGGAGSYCLSWRLGVEVNNVRGWRTVPFQCLRYIESYMVGGQYDRDVELIVDQILGYVNSIVVSHDGRDAWIMDVDDTCISNLFYYKGKHYGCDPYDPAGFKAWAMTGMCPSIPVVLELFNILIRTGFKVFLVTGRDQDTLGQVTIDNLRNQGFIGYQRLILRTAGNKGQGAVTYKSEVRRELEGEGYRIWGNVGDQWSDLTGDCSGNRTFKLPNPMYFVP